MIVPRPRLLAWTAALVLPLTMPGMTTPLVRLAAAAALSLLVGLASADAALARRRFRGLTARPPELLRLSLHHPGFLEVEVGNDSSRPRRLRVGFEFPPEISTSTEDQTADLPPGGTRLRLRWECRPNRRGRYFLRHCFQEVSSAFGFWDVRRVEPSSIEIRVYPNLISERKRIAAWFQPRGGIGIRPRRQVGKGREFEKLREYIPGDSYEDIHWKATARRGRPITKVFQVERRQEIYVVLDASRLAARPRGSPPVADLERLITATLVLAQAAERQGDRFGLVVFSDSVHSFLRAGAGRASFNAAREVLYNLRPRGVAPDFEELTTFLRIRLRRRGLLFFLTHLDDPVLAEHFVRSVDLVRRQHLVLVGMPRPPEARPIFSDGVVSGLDDLYRNLAGHLTWKSLRELSRTLEQRGVTFTLLEHESLSAEMVSRYVDAKRRQSL